MILLLQANDDPARAREWHLLGAPSGHDPAYLLEVARKFSIERHSELVLCRAFLAGIDLAVSAADDAWPPLQSSAAQVESRCRQLVSLIDQTREPMRQGAEWCRTVLPLGLVRWWPRPVRKKALAALGPFAVTLDAERAGPPVVQLAAPPLPWPLLPSSGPP